MIVKGSEKAGIRRLGPVSSQVSRVKTWQDALVGRVVQLQRQLDATGLGDSRSAAGVLGMCGVFPG